MTASPKPKLNSDRKANMGKAHPCYTSTTLSMAERHLCQGDIDAALQLYEEALEVYKVHASG